MAHFVGVGTASASNNAGLTPALPSGLTRWQPGDLLVLVFTARGDGTISTPTGWTELTTISHSSSGINKIKICYKVAGSSESAPSVTYTGGAAGHTVIAQVAAFRNILTTDPIDVLGSTGENVSQVNVGPIPSITTLTDGSVAVVVGHKASTWTSVNTLSETDVPWVEMGETTSASGNDASLVWDAALIETAATLSAKTFTVNPAGGTSATGLGIAFALKTLPDAVRVTKAYTDLAAIPATSAARVTKAHVDAAVVGISAARVTKVYVDVAVAYDRRQWWRCVYGPAQLTGTADGWEGYQ